MNRAKIDYALIGGLAFGYRAHPRSTRDTDLLLQVPQIGLPPLLDELAAVGFLIDTQKTIREWTEEHMTTFEYHGIRVDWLKPVIPAYQHILDRATEEDWLGHTIRIASPEGLILLKLLAARGQDLVDVEKLVAAHGDKLDIEWIRNEWNALLSLDDPRMIRLMDLVAARKALP